MNLAICLIETAKLEPDSNHIEAAIEALKSARAIATEDAPHLLSSVSNNLGAVYMAKRVPLGGDDRLLVLELAMTEFARSILEAQAHINIDVWGAAHLNCARILMERVTNSEMDATPRRFARLQALAHCTAAIETYSSTLFPDKYAEANGQLAEVLGALALESPEPFSTGYFNRALDAYECAAPVFSRKNNPYRWADIHMRVGTLFGNKAWMAQDRAGRSDYIDQARNCFEAAAEVFDSLGDTDHALACRAAVSQVVDSVMGEATTTR